MKPLKRIIIFITIGIILPSMAIAEFTADQFDKGLLSAAWKVPQAKAKHFKFKDGSLIIFPSGERTSLTAQQDYSFVEQTAPEGSDWEIVTKCQLVRDGSDFKVQPWNECGMLLYQDDKHWFGLWISTNADGSLFGVVGGYHCQPQSDTAVGNLNYSGDQAKWATGNVPVWLKIQKTQKGYFGLASLDGSQWFHLCQMVRNPENPQTGYFENEKIRLFSSRVSKSDFDMAGRFGWLKHEKTSPLPNGFSSDEFNGSSLDTNIWTVFPGVPISGSISQSDGFLSLLPADWHDQWGAYRQSNESFSGCAHCGELDS